MVKEIKEALVKLEVKLVEVHYNSKKLSNMMIIGRVLVIWRMRE